MEPRIQYVRSSDGVNIAYAVFGSGPPIVWTAKGVPEQWHLFGVEHASVSPGPILGLTRRSARRSGAMPRLAISLSGAGFRRPGIPFP